MSDKQTGFATTPEILRGFGPQMEDYPDWNSWYEARQLWVMEKMLRQGRWQPPSAAESEASK